MNRVNYTRDSSKFWETHEKTRKVRDEKSAKLPFAHKIAITERLQADRISLQNAKKIT
jgi:hypothetical protein